jgi:NADH-quinone oxidoreductase subunit K
MNALFNVGLVHFLIVGAIVFALGVLTVSTRRNAVSILMGVELVLNAANINYVAFAHYVSGSVNGQVFAVFIIVLAAAEAAIALAIVLAIFRNFRSIDATETSTLKE